MTYDTPEVYLWADVVKQAVHDLVKGLDRMTRPKKKKGRAYTPQITNTAFSFLFDDTHPVSDSLRGGDVLEMAGCVRTIRQAIIKRCRRDLGPDALEIFERALVKLK